MVRIDLKLHGTMKKTTRSMACSTLLIAVHVKSALIPLVTGDAQKDGHNGKIPPHALDTRRVEKEGNTCPKLAIVKEKRQGRSVT